MNISTTKKGGAYSAPTSMSVPSLKRNVILLSAYTVAVSRSVSHMYDEDSLMSRFAKAYGYQKPSEGDAGEDTQG